MSFNVLYEIKLNHLPKRWQEYPRCLEYLLFPDGRAGMLLPKGSSLAEPLLDDQPFPLVLELMELCGCWRDPGTVWEHRWKVAPWVLQWKSFHKNNGLFHFYVLLKVLRIVGTAAVDFQQVIHKDGGNCVRPAKPSTFRESPDLTDKQVKHKFIFSCFMGSFVKLPKWFRFVKVGNHGQVAEMRKKLLFFYCRKIISSSVNIVVQACVMVKKH